MYSVDSLFMNHVACIKSHYFILLITFPTLKTRKIRRVTWYNRRHIFHEWKMNQHHNIVFFFKEYI